LAIYIAITVILCYLLGNVNNALIISKLKKSDIRECGSGNPGAMNMFRNYGFRFGLLTLVLDGVKGAGHYIGTYIHWGVHNNSWWGEGEIKFYIDGDTDFPSICGTGTEDYFLGAYNFDVGGKCTEYTTPYAGLSKVGATDGTYRSQRFFDMYRWHICDPIYFEKDLRVTIQALGWRSESRYRPLKDTISSVAYYYSDTFNEPPRVPSRDDIELA